MTKEKLKYSRKVLISLVEKKDDPKLLFNELEKIRGYGENKNKELAIRYIIKLNQEFNLDIYLLAKNAIEEGKGWYNILNLIIDSTSKLILESTSL